MQPNHPNTATASFIGSWKLVAAEFRLSSGEITYPLGENPTGLLIYDRHGIVSAQLMRSDRAFFASGDQKSGTNEEIKAAFESFVSYYGTYGVDEKNKAVNHQVKGSLFPNWVGQVQKRFFEFSGDKLTLRTPPIRTGGKEVVGVLVWERIK